MEDISLIPGNKHSDERGILSFFNDFDMSAIKRFYLIEHPDTKIIRAWQGHRYEQKWFYVVSGAFRMVIIRPDDWKKPSRDLRHEIFYLSEEKSQVLHIPGGFATGFVALEENSRMIIFSDATVEESQKDDYRFEKGMWPVAW